MPDTTTPDNRGRIKLELFLTLILTLVNIIGGGVFWFTLPERIKQTETLAADHETRIRWLEKDAGERAGLLSRIDERTKTIQEALSDIKREVRRTP